MISVTKPEEIRRGIEELNRACPFAPELDGYAPRLCLFEAGETVLSFESPVRYLYLVVTGTLFAAIPNANGGLLLHVFCGPGDSLGELELFRGCGSISQVKSYSQSRCLQIDIGRYRRKMMEDPAFLLYLAENLAVKLEGTAVNSAQNLLLPVESRLARRILLQEHGGIYRENLSVITKFLGTSYRHLQRCLEGMINKGCLVRSARGVYRIQDRAALEQLAKKD